MKCYNCGQWGHMSAALFCGLEQKPPAYLRPPSVRHSGQVEGTRVDLIVLDTGCSRTMVRRDLVPDNKIIEGMQSPFSEHMVTQYYTQ